MQTLENIKTNLVFMMNELDRAPIVIHDDAIKQITTMREKLVELSGFDETKLTQDDLVFIHDVLQAFRPEYLVSQSTIVDNVLQPADQAEFDAAVALMIQNAEGHDLRYLFPSILVADYAIENKTFNL